MSAARSNSLAEGIAKSSALAYRVMMLNNVPTAIVSFRAPAVTSERKAASACSADNSIGRSVMISRNTNALLRAWDIGADRKSASTVSTNGRSIARSVGTYAEGTGIPFRDHGRHQFALAHAPRARTAHSRLRPCAHRGAEEVLVVEGDTRSVRQPDT